MKTGGWAGADIQGLGGKVKGGTLSQGVQIRYVRDSGRLNKVVVVLEGKELEKIFKTERTELE